MGKSFVIGKGTTVTVAMLPTGSEVEPTPTTITLAALAAKDVDGTASITVPALGAGVVIPAGSVLAFVHPTTGAEIVVQLDEDAGEGDTTLVVKSIPEDIASGSVADYPLKLRGRNSANLSRSGNRESFVTFDDDAFSTGLTTSIEAGLELQGAWLPTDAGYSTLEYAFTELRVIYCWLQLPKISDAYSKGRVYKFVASITDLPLEVSADGVIQGNITLAVNGKPTLVPDVPVA